MGIVISDWSKWSYGRQVFSDKSNGETLKAMYPVQLYDDFTGEAYNTAFWGTTAVKTGGTLVSALSDDIVNGSMALGLDNTDESQIIAMHFGDNLCLSMNQGLIFEARLTFTTLPTTGTQTVQSVWGLASSHATPLDNVTTNAWFRLESGAQTTLLWETDNGDTDDDDNDASTTLVASTYNIYRIDCTDTSAVKFYVDETLVGTSDMSTTLSSDEAKVQPYFNVSKIKSTNNTGTGTMLIDYVRCYQSRS